MSLDQMPNQNEIALEQLKARSMNLRGIYLAGTDTKLDDIVSSMNSGTYNENGGVIVYKLGDEVFATPSSRGGELVQTAGLMLDEKVGVPNLNDGEVWEKDEVKRNGLSGFQDWKKLSE